MTSPVPDALRTRLAEVLAADDQCSVHLELDYEDHAYLADLLLPAIAPFLARARAEGAAEALRDLADTPRESPWDPPWQAVADPLFNATLRNLADQYEALTKETPDA